MSNDMLRAILSVFLFTTAALAGKRGLDWTYYNNALNPGLFKNSDGQVVAIYDYETYPPVSSNGNGGLGFIGMQRCLDCSSSPIAQLKTRQQQQGWATVFSLNEPDINGISPSSAASWYKTYINPLGIKKAFPAVTSSTTSGQGLSWLSQMISACGGGCYADYINLHWYGNNFASFQSYVQQAHNQFPQYTIVVSEFALQNPPGGQADQINFFKQAFSFLDSASYVTLYFPFIATSPSLFQQYDSSGASYVGTGSCLYNNDGSVSAVGKLLI